jgi:heptosyltransferase I
MHPTPNCILIIKPSSLGDVVTTLPMLCDLKAALPNAHIDWVIHPGLKALVAGHPAVSNLIEFDRKRMAAWWWKPAAYRLFRKLISDLRRPKYDCVIDAQGLLRSGIFSRFTGAAMRVGFADAREGAKWLYTHRAALPKEPQVAVVRMRALLAPLGVDTTQAARYEVPIDPAARESIDHAIPAGQSPIVIIPGARWDTKRWSVDGFREIAARIRNQNIPVLLLGSPDEAALCNQIEQGVPGTINLAGKTNLAQMIAALDRARLVIGNDSGPLHVAVALGKPVVALYGPTDPNFVGPYGQLDHVIRFDVPCHPCRRRTCDHHSCMRGVTVDAVWAMTRELAGIV